MRAFEVSVNGRRLTVAGIGERGSLSALVYWNPESPAGDYLHVSALNIITREHLDWGEVELSTGDEVTIKVIEATSVDPPCEVKKYQGPAGPNEA
jgi:hypothetical protein